MILEEADAGVSMDKRERVDGHSNIQITFLEKVKGEWKISLSLL